MTRTATAVITAEKIGTAWRGPAGHTAPPSAAVFAERLHEVSRAITRLQDAMTLLEGDAYDRGGARWDHAGTAGHVLTTLEDLLSGLEDPASPLNR